jgi:hypothetical protein
VPQGEQAAKRVRPRAGPVAQARCGRDQRGRGASGCPEGGANSPGARWSWRAPSRAVRARTPRARRAAAAAVEPASGREGHPQNSVHRGQHYAASHGRSFPRSGTPMRPPAVGAVYYDKTLPFFHARHPGWQPLSRRAHATGSGHAPAGTAAGDEPTRRTSSKSPSGAVSTGVPRGAGWP